MCDQNSDCSYAAACYDPLTRLPSYYLFREQFIRHTAEPHSGECSALLIISLDQFKTIQFACGHAVTDLLLLAALQRIRVFLYENGNMSRISHIESDRFVVLLGSLGEDLLSALFHSSQLASQIGKCLAEPYQFDSGEYRVTASIGACLFRSNEGESIDDLCKHTHIAMYRAQLEGGNTWRFFDRGMQQAVKERYMLEAELSYVLPRGQLALFFQAQVDRQHRIYGAEVLLRWKHPAMGLIMPTKFIPIAEETGHIVAIGYWLIEQTCIQLKAWENDPYLCDMVLAVNVSAKQFQQIDFVHRVFMTLDKTGINPAKLQMEITESVMVSEIDNIISKMNKLKSRGIKFSIDDFGTGYSSLVYLEKMPLDQLKIDQQFVKDITKNPKEQAIVKIIIAMAGALGFGVLAEGVETSEQRNCLEGLGCFNFQGYLYGKPEPLDAFEKNRTRCATLSDSDFEAVA